MPTRKRPRPGARQAERIVEGIILDPPGDGAELFERMRRIIHPEEGYRAARERRRRYPEGSAVRLDLEEVMERGLRHAWWLIVRRLLERLPEDPDELFHLYEVLERLEEDRYETVRVWLERWRRGAGLGAQELYGPALATGRLWFLSDVMEVAVAREERRRRLTARFPVGAEVEFEARRRGRLRGRVLRVNRRSVSVETATGLWRVAPEALEPVARQGTAGEERVVN